MQRLTKQSLDSRMSELVCGGQAAAEEGQKALPAPSTSGKEEGVLDGLWVILKSAKDNIVNHPRVVALSLQSILAIWQVSLSVTMFPHLKFGEFCG